MYRPVEMSVKQFLEEEVGFRKVCTQCSKKQEDNIGTNRACVEFGKVILTTLYFNP